jgi:putative membrane protein
METRSNILARLGFVTVMVGALYLTGSITVRAATNESGALSTSDRTFINKAPKGGEMEVTMGNVAVQNATNADVKSFGQRMVTDHSKANEELESIAEKKGVKLPTQEPSEK